jgi:hypothetical protein
MKLTIKTGSSIKKDEAINLNIVQVYSFFEKGLLEQGLDQLYSESENELKFEQKLFHFGRIFRPGPFIHFNSGELKISENDDYINIDLEAEFLRMLIQIGSLVFGFALLAFIANGFRLNSLPLILTLGAILLVIKWFSAKYGLKVFLDRKTQELKTWR